MTLSYKFTIDPDAYAKGHGIEIKDKGKDDSSEDNANANGDGDTQNADSAVAQDVANDSQRPVSECEAANPITCRFHGMQLIQHEIEERIHAIVPNAQINLTRPNSNVRNTYALQITFGENITPGQQRRVARAMDQFFRGAGVTEDAVEGDTTRSRHSSMFDIDELDPNYGEGEGTNGVRRENNDRNRELPREEGLQARVQRAIIEGARQRELARRQAEAAAARRQAEARAANANNDNGGSGTQTNALENARQQVAAKRSELGVQGTSPSENQRPDVTAPDFGGNESLSAIFGNAANRANARRKGTQNNG